MGDVAVQLVNEKGQADKVYYINLSDQFGGQSDVFACVAALCPDPEEDGSYMFFFGYYGERWTEKAHVKLNKALWKVDMIEGWLSYMLWKQCVDKFQAMALCDDDEENEEENKEECVDKYSAAKPLTLSESEDEDEDDN